MKQMDSVATTMSNGSDAVGTLPQRVRRDFSDVDYDEAMRRAREMVPILSERAQRAEDARMLIRDNEQLLHESGLFRFHQPKPAITGSSATTSPRRSAKFGTPIRMR